jgi:protein involved in polysaccharide export with SLBB domain
MGQNSTLLQLKIALRWLAMGIATLLIPTVAYNRHVEARVLSPQNLTSISNDTNLTFLVTGEVKRRARYFWREGLTLTNGIDMAGGVTDFADINRIELRHPDGSVERFNYRRILKGVATSPPVKPNDQVVVRGKRF